MVERAINVKLPRETKQSGGSYSRRDRYINTMTQRVVQAAAVEAFHIMWNVLIEPKTERGESCMKTAEEKKRRSKREEEI